MARILVVDDDSCQLELRARLLEAGGHQTAVAFSPAETLRRLGAAGVIIMDLRFPNALGESDAREGLSLIRRIRESGCRAPIIVISGWPQDIEGTPEAQLVSRVMAKPVGMAALLAAVADLTAAASARP